MGDKIRTRLFFYMCCILLIACIYNTIPVTYAYNALNLEDSTEPSYEIVPNSSVKGESIIQVYCPINRIIDFENFQIKYAIPHYMTLKANNSYLYAAKFEKDRINIDSSLSDEEFCIRYYQALTNEPYQDTILEDFINQLRKVKRAHNLSENEYFEYIQDYVQRIPYYSEPDGRIKPPILTVFEGFGDCDDKSLLLACLLSMENYDVTLFLIHDELMNQPHMVLGVRSDYFTFQDTGYTLIETTVVSQSGISRYQWNSDNSLMIPIGKGNKSYNREYSMVIVYPDRIYKKPVSSNLQFFQ